jgi:hypothetical protein
VRQAPERRRGAVGGPEQQQGVERIAGGAEVLAAPRDEARCAGVGQQCRHWATLTGQDEAPIIPRLRFRLNGAAAAGEN